jgi:hypothetical protein
MLQANARSGKQSNNMPRQATCSWCCCCHHHTQACKHTPAYMLWHTSPLRTEPVTARRGSMAHIHYTRTLLFDMHTEERLLCDTPPPLAVMHHHT